MLRHVCQPGGAAADQGSHADAAAAAPMHPCIHSSPPHSKEGSQRSHPECAVNAPPPHLSTFYIVTDLHSWKFEAPRYSCR